jgi:hypothetical protein
MQFGNEIMMDTAMKNNGVPSDLERATMRRVTYRLLPFLMACYLVSFIDRVNVGFAALQMNKDIGLTASMFGLGSGLFFVTYFIFEVPSNLVLEKVGARLWIARIMITWGLVSAATALVVGPYSFYLVRFLLGAAEAGFYPGVLLYLTLWFPKACRARVVALFMVSVPAASFIGSPISAAFLQLDGWLGLHGWQWMSILEAAPAILFGGLAFFVLPCTPLQATWLTVEQRRWLTDRINNERDGVRSSGRRDCVAWRRGAKGDGRNTRNPVCYLGDTGIVRVSKLEHAVQGRSSDGNLSHLGSVGARSKGIANHAFVSPDRHLDLGSQIVVAGLLPRHPAAFGDHLQMAVALCRVGLGRSTQDRGCSRRHNDGSVWMTFDNRMVDPVVIVGTIGGEGSDGIGDLVEQSTSHCGIIDILPGHRDGDDLAAGGINTDMQFAPRSATGRAVLFDQPFAGSAELQTGAVHQQMQPAGTGSPEQWHLKRLRPAAQRRVVRHREVKPEQCDDGADQPLGLAQRQSEHHAHRQGRGDRQD